ncbi:MAG: radical SAM protein [Candidatus Omnitrophica bacterium]|nr:radical SAM protein [Candidatus Omnitrophota bacterium]
MKVLLIQPPHYYGTHSRPPSSFPLGAAYIVSALKDAGHLVEVWDIYAQQLPTIEAENQIRNLASDFEAICISALSTQYKYVKWLIERLKSKFDNPIILGNALATFNHEAVLRYTAADICVIGEGERTLIDLLENIEDLSKVKGIAYRQDGRIVSNPQREYIRDLDSINFPQRDAFGMDIYLKNTCLWSNPEIRTVDIITARGCPYNCNFCSKTFKGMRLRSIDNVIKEIEGLRSQYNFKGIKFNDELTLINKERVYALCKYLKKSGLSWVCQGRVNLVDQDLLKAMKDSGCKALGFGIESGSQKILDNMNKGISVDEAIAAVRATKRAGIEPIIQMMHGYPGEDDITLKETEDFFKATNSPTIQFSMTTALPGTVLYNQAYEKGLIKDEDAYLEKLDWGYYGEREILTNFTNFSDNELLKKRRDIESKINQHYRKYLIMHPWAAFKIIFHKINSYYLRYGLIKTFKKIFNSLLSLKNDNWML